MKIKNIIVVTASLGLLLAVSGCTTKVIDPATGQSTTQFDPVKTEQVKALLEPIGAGAVRRIITNSPQHSDEIAGYFRAVGSVFCQMSANNDFDPAYLIGAADAATAKFQANVPQEAIDVKNALVALYKVNFEGRFRAELPPDKWPKNVADVICVSIDQGLKDSGKPGSR